jgi:hypothetical protein
MQMLNAMQVAVAVLVQLVQLVAMQHKAAELVEPELLVL